MPGGLLVAAALGFLRPGGLPAWALPLVGLYCYLILGAGVLLCWFLDRNRVLLAIVVLMLVDWALLHFVAGDVTATGVSRVVFDATALLLPLNLLAFSLIPERGLRIKQEAVRLVLILCQALLVAWICLPDQAVMAESLEFAFIAPRLTSWTPIPQPALLAFGAALVLLTFRSVLSRSLLERRNAIEIGFVWALVAAFVGLHGSRAGWLPTNFFATAELILVLAVYEATHKMTHYDALTGVRGRDAFTQALRGLGKRYSIAVADIDRFKQVNARHGYSVGNQVLRLIAERMTSMFDQEDVFRLEGGRFIILFRNKSVPEALPHLDALRKAVEALSTTPLGDRIVTQDPGTADSSLGQQIVTISIGVAERDDRKPSPEKVMKVAERLLNQAKRSGRNQVKPPPPTGKSMPAGL